MFTGDKWIEIIFHGVWTLALIPYADEDASHKQHT